LELEGAISTVFAACLNSKFSFSMEFATFWCYLQHFGAGSCHVNNICRFLEPIIFHGHGICNILVLELFIEHGSLQLRFI
jgi:hypothetical protein